MVELSSTGAYYIRVANERADDDRQRESIQNWLAANGLSIPPEFRFEDEGFNRETLPQNRPALQQMLAAVAAGKVKWVVVDTLDRFRSQADPQLMQVAATFHDAGAQLISLETGEAVPLS